MSYDRNEFERLTYPLYIRLRDLDERYGWRFIVRNPEPEFWVWSAKVVVQVKWNGSSQHPKFETFATTGESYVSENIDSVIQVLTSEYIAGDE